MKIKVLAYLIINLYNNLKMSKSPVSSIERDLDWCDLEGETTEQGNNQNPVAKVVKPLGEDKKVETPVPNPAKKSSINQNDDPYDYNENYCTCRGGGNGECFNVNCPYY